MKRTSGGNGNIVLLLCSVLFCCLLGEAAVRLGGRYDEAGNFYFQARKLKPYQPYRRTTREALDKYFASSDSILIYDPGLGWTYRPNSRAQEGKPYLHNSDGIRTASTDCRIEPAPRQGSLRIAILGDSFTYAYDVPFEDSWGARLEENLQQAGIDAEVLNFGVGCYGMDQAFLRWKAVAASFKPHVVLFGLCLKNVERNVNLIRGFLSPFIPFSKPRFIVQGDELRLINAPALDPHRILSTMDHIDEWPLAQHEYWYRREDYRKKIWHASKLLTLLFQLAEEARGTAGRGTSAGNMYALEGEPARVTIKIIEAFKKDVESSGATFYAVYLPWLWELNILADRGPLPYTRLLNAIEDITTVIHPEGALLSEAATIKPEGLFAAYQGHYSVKGNGIIADVLARFLLQEGIAAQRGAKQGAIEE